MVWMNWCESMLRARVIRARVVSRPLVKLAVIAILYLSVFLLVTWYSGHLRLWGSETIFFYSSNDATGYKQLADYAVSLGKTERPSDYLLKHRDFLFPLYLSTYHLIGVGGLQLLQIAMNVVSLWLVFISLEITTRRLWLAIVGTALLAVTPSFTFLALYALTETVSLLLIALFGMLMVLHFHRGGAQYVPLSVGVLSLLVCIRPIVLPFWVIVTVFYLFVWRRSHDVPTWHAASLISPVFCQLLFSFLITGSPAVASVGSVAFEEWFFPVVYEVQEYGQFTGRKSDQAMEGLRRFPEFLDKVIYIVQNLRTTVVTYLSLLIGEHLTAGSNFVKTGVETDDGAGGVRAATLLWSVHLNQAFLCLHVTVLLGLLILMVSGKQLLVEPISLLLYMFTAFLILPAGLAYMQGDRYIVLAEPLWLVAHGTLFAHFLDTASRPPRTSPILVSSP